ncbi:MAG TPA: FAD-dependent monooxygenase [Kofleriaceae bacterium]|nr:FAD-dependent monooxygenase [Kofleriaceae bacterium]
MGASRIISVGGGPAGLYFGILAKQADPSRHITIIERNRPNDTFGFGVVFSDATLENLARADGQTYQQIRHSFAHWDDIDIHWRGQVLRSTGHGFCGMERRLLLEILQARCAELGVELRFEEEVRDVRALAAEADLLLGADGVQSGVRQALRDGFEPDVDVRPNRFVWLGTTFPFQAFTFYFRENRHGLWRVHAYRYRDEAGGAADGPAGVSTFIVECTAETFARSGLREEDEDATIAYLEEVFAEELAGHRLVKNRSIWRSFPTVRNRRWHTGNVVLLGDAAHTAHFSIGSGTKLAMEDAIALSEALAAEPELPAALARYEAERRPGVEALQRAAQVSLEWFEGTERYREMEPIQLAFSLLTRSLRVSHAGLERRDPVLVEAVDSWFAARHGVLTRAPALVPLRLGDREVKNRLVALGRAPTEVGGQPIGLVLGDVIEVSCAGQASAAVAAARCERGGEPVVARVPDGDGDAAVALARELREAGADAVLVGQTGGEIARLAFVPLADRVRNEAGVTTIVAGGIRTVDEVSTIVAAGRADLCVIG